jgi:hypothetical protein
VLNLLTDGNGWRNPVLQELRSPTRNRRMYAVSIDRDALLQLLDRGIDVVGVLRLVGLSRNGVKD